MRTTHTTTTSPTTPLANTPLNFFALSSLVRPQEVKQVVRFMASKPDEDDASAPAQRCLLEVPFIRTYETDTIQSPEVRANLWKIMDLDEKWESIETGRRKLRKASNALDPNAATDEYDEEAAMKALDELPAAVQEYEEAMGQAEEAREELEGLGDEPAEQPEDATGGDDSDAEMEDDDAKKSVEIDAKAAAIKEYRLVKNKVQAFDTLVYERSQKVDSLTTMSAGPSRSDPSGAPAASDAFPAAASGSVFHKQAYLVVMEENSQNKELSDMATYMSLIAEGTLAVKVKEGAAEQPKRSRRKDREAYRVAVGDGARQVAYTFLMPPWRMGYIVDQSAQAGLFNYSSRLLDSDDGNPAVW